MKSIPVTFNLTLAIILSLANIFLLFGLPFLLAKHFLWLLFVIPILICSNMYWGLIHEAIHFLLHPNKVTNERVGRMLSILFGCAFRLLRTGHLLHHRYNRSSYDRPEVYQADRHHWLSKTLYYYWFLINGLYAMELFLPLLSFLPRKLLSRILKYFGNKNPEQTPLAHFQKQLLQATTLHQIRIDTAIIILLYSLSLFLYGQFFWLLVGILLIRGFLISAADNLPHYGTPINQTYYAYNLSAPKWLQIILLNFNYHRIHHQRPNLPWCTLPSVFTKQADQFDGNYFQQWRRQFLGLIPLEHLPIFTDSIDLTKKISQISQNSHSL